ncbi:TetR/AcrR family transcriptional regulator [Zhongshania aquimaris]|jgi:AcrR family transcriptional regulator|uniref:TetR/AcrR family transcriptional regulator n=1 Tax=Zhongshania aquimaris TaxID=2857107 RepID=A0ABS6VVY4_9GAMM|nr:TetR/AcrR family transcriptional regulator [Zhongshania aquimaris]MBW2942173.1 TetR/AcrR family transcriptional regulator [Zhongshania aquimaris]
MASPTLNSKANYHHGDLRKELIKEAILIIREDGVNALSMRKLALNVGVSRNAYTYHFKDKKTLLSAIAEEGFKIFTKRLRLTTNDNNIKLTKKRVTEFVTNYIYFAIDHAEYYELMFGQELWASQSSTESLKKEAHQAFKNYAGQIAEYHRQGKIPITISPLQYAETSWATLHGMSRFLVDRIYTPESADEMCASIINLFWAQLNPK